MELHPEVQTFLDALRALQNHLDDFDAFWADQVRIAADEVSRSDAHGVKRFLSFFGRMGSLNDLVLSRDEIVLVVENEQLDALRSKAWDLAINLRG